jgi:cytoskeleton protein RodZ
LKTDEAKALSAGGLLRAAREKQGLHIAALAASIKVAPRKLDALENDRWDELSGAIFTRALAQSVCRALRIDPAPILALLPPPKAVELDHVTGRLNAPFRERSARDEGALAAMAQRGLLWAGATLLVAAVVTFLLPASWLSLESASALVASEPNPAPTAAPIGAAAVAPTAAAPASASMVPPSAVAASAPAPVLGASAPALVEVTHGAPSATAVQATVQAATTAAALQLSASEVSWVEVRDGAGRILLSRNVLRGETIGVDGAAPLRLTVGNAAATRVVFRGQPVELATGQRDNVARLELK